MATFLGDSYTEGSRELAWNMYSLMTMAGNVTDLAKLPFNTSSIANETVIGALLTDVLPNVKKNEIVGTGSPPPSDCNC